MTDLTAYIRALPYCRRLAIAMKIADVRNNELARALGKSTNTVYNWTSPYCKRTSKKSRAAIADYLAGVTPVVRIILED